ncbi:unnamed protein product [Vicia faba]|uniref:GTD-binding domain-containing protein n=1 Tax=Vicia faba TaxID=3906 RepID=A0AAV1B4T3_VICFA|nr:unnamed protein product [Vicia faba]
MAANKFATMLHRNTNKITLVLVYAILEWILIVFLLLNSLFSYFIIKFADFFGLKTPCMWCARIDHFFESGKTMNPCRDLVCEAHALEISKLGFCLNHHKLAEFDDMCEDCSVSVSFSSKSVDFFPWMKEIDRVEGGVQKDEEGLRCSCCGVNFDNRFYPPCVVVNPSMNILENLEYEPNSEKVNLIKEGVFVSEVDHCSDHSRSGFSVVHHENRDKIEEKSGILELFEVEQNCACSVCDGVKETMVDDLYKLEIGLEKGKEETLEEERLKLVVPKANDDGGDEVCDLSSVEVEKIEEVQTKHLDFFIHGDDCRLIPVELVDSGATENGNQSRYNKGVDEGFRDNEDFILDFHMNNTDAEAKPLIENWHISDAEAEPLIENWRISDAEAEPLIENWRISGDIVAEFSCQEKKIFYKVNEAESGLQVEQNLEQNHQDEDLTKDDNVEVNIERMMHGDGELGSYVSLASEDASQTQSDEFEAEVSIGTEIPDQEHVDEYQGQDVLFETNQRMQDDSSTSSVRFYVQHDSGHDKGEEEFVEFNTMSLEVRMPTSSNHMPSSFELNENEEEKFSDTPTSLESLHQLHKKLLFLERKESGTEDSLDGSVISDIECGEVTLDKLKSALKSERKALKTLYAELEEERNASAVAANQTMAMINRLQEEKAAMQMEALQYQRMMDEQSEYDQEAMQLLNDLMLKREKEKHEVEKELEVYRKKVHEYEVREKMMLSRRDSSIRSRTSSLSCSNAEDSDGVSIDFNQETKEENGFHNNHQECSSNQNTPVEAVLYLEESLSSFEEERLSILEQLKVLEEKLIILNYEEDHCFDDDTTSIEHLREENGNGYHDGGHDHDHDDHQGQVNGFVNGNGKHHQGRKITAIKAKRLLPLFDAISTETEDVELSGDENELDFSQLQKISAEKANLDKKKIGLEEEVDHVYERLQVLEADREFLKHCISSLRKGDKGLHLLQEILQHLRDLRNVELRLKNTGDLAV